MQFLGDLHADYIKSLSAKKDTFEYHATEHLRMSGAYWGCTAMALMRKEKEMDREAVVSWVLSCRHDNGGFGGNVGHDPHLLYTLSAIQLLALYDAMERLPNPEVTVRYVAGLQKPDGSFMGDEWGEIDTRFSYCALSCLSLLGRVDAVDVKAATDFVARCKNFDGGFGCVPGAESHAGQVFTCVGALAIGNALHHVDVDLLGWWLSERQTKSGGLNGRPEKLPDVCYSWWVLSSMVILGRLHWLDSDALANFILKAQDPDDGGIADRPDDMPDVFHTFFGIAGLSLLGREGLEIVDPVYALPQSTLERLGLSVWGVDAVAE